MVSQDHKAGRPSPARRWVLAGILAGGVALVVSVYAGSSSTPTSQPAAPTIRVATIRQGDLRQTVRVSGVIAAERFAAIVAPRLHGSRGDHGRTATANTDLSVAPVNTDTGNPNAGAGGSSSSSDPNGSLLGSAGASSSTAATNTSSSLGAKRGTVNRFNSTQSASTTLTNLPNAATVSSATSASGTSALGSTAGSLLGGGGGGGGDFMLVLVNVAKAGGMVKKGEVVAEFDRVNMLNRLDDYRASVIQLEADVKKLRADQAAARDAHDQLLHAAKADLDKALLDLKTISVRSAIEAENYKLTVQEDRARYEQLQKENQLFRESLRAQMQSADLDVQQARIELRRAEANTERMVIKAPIDGIVVMQTIRRAGDFGQVQKGDQVWPGQFFMSIVDPGSMVVNATINQVDSELLRIGMKAVTRLDAYPDMTLPATIVGVGAMTQPGMWRASYMREIPVRLELNAMDPRVIPDLSASAEIVLQSESQRVIAPLEAIFRDTPRGRPFVYLQGPAGWIRRDVELGLANHVAVAVRSGLQKGDVVAAQRP